MKAISLWQPWASLIAVGAKQYETRSWATSYRGPLAIHTAKRKPRASELSMWIMRTLLNHGQPLYRLPLGYVICVVDLVDCVPTWEIVKLTHTSERARIEMEFGDYGPERWAWKLENVRSFEPIPASGKQGLWDWTPPKELAV